MPNQYCTLNDIRNRLSPDGVTYRLDDTPPDATDGDVLDNVGTYIDEFCLPLYEYAHLASSEWVKQRATDIGAFLLCERRGNPPPPGVSRAFMQYVGTVDRPGRMDLIRKGTMAIPGLPKRREAVPVVSNLRVRLDPVLHVVVERARSTGKSDGYTQHADRLEIWNYQI